MPQEKTVVKKKKMLRMALALLDVGRGGIQPTEADGSPLPAQDQKKYTIEHMQSDSLNLWLKDLFGEEVVSIDPHHWQRYDETFDYFAELLGVDPEIAQALVKPPSKGNAYRLDIRLRDELLRDNDNFKQAYRQMREGFLTHKARLQLGNAPADGNATTEGLPDNDTIPIEDLLDGLGLIEDFDNIPSDLLDVPDVPEGAGERISPPPDMPDIPATPESKYNIDQLDHLPESLSKNIIRGAVEEVTPPPQGESSRRAEVRDFERVLEALGERARTGNLPLAKLRKLADLLSAELAEMEAVDGCTPPNTC
mmetsp:Transcript_13956/g.29826  ORF Transcript_13956/g.29826 Transcript_13956/m.29826 type:complete len:309 (-) Transcript_13956:169-1095(-)